MSTNRWLATLALLPLLVAANPSNAPEPAAGGAGRRMLELEAREAALRVLEEDIAARIEELKGLREAAVAAILPQEQERADQLKTLINFYQAMKPKQAARLLEQLPPKLAAQVLSSMKSRTAGKILDVMDAERAVVISKLMAGRK